MGCPLRVHRRCDELIFSISNTIAYDHLMVYGTEFRTPLDAPHSAWFNIQSDHADGHWVPAEGLFIQKHYKSSFAMALIRMISL